MRQPTHDYIGRKPCGCVAATVYDLQDGDTGRTLSRWVRKGLTIQRVPMAYVKEHIDTWFNCPHEVVQEVMQL